MTVLLTRRAHFCAGHRYWRADWTPAKNRDVFGACANENGHGHNYILDVTVSGPIDPSTGMVMNLGHLDRLIRELVIDRVDHRNLNVDIPELSGRVPTTEVLADFIWNALVDRISIGTLAEIRICEADDLWASVRA